MEAEGGREGGFVSRRCVCRDADQLYSDYKLKATAVKQMQLAARHAPSRSQRLATDARLQ